jgi:hypothetical protein
LAPRWYEFLEDVVVRGIAGSDVRVRLHPAESRSMVPGKVWDRVEHGRPLLEDLDWAATVASPFSTVLVEALAARRRPLLLLSGPAMTARAREFPVFADQAFPVCGWTREALASSLENQVDVEPLLEDYLVADAHSAERAAAAILECGGE